MKFIKDILEMVLGNERINLQQDGTKAKAYQVKQVRNILLKYKQGPR